MRQVHCDGCGFTEPDDLAQKKQQILRVTVSVSKDPRFPEGVDKHEADLCPDCQGRMLHTYFKVPAKGKLETPAFIGPRNLEEIIEPGSRKA